MPLWWHFNSRISVSREIRDKARTRRFRRKLLSLSPWISRRIDSRMLFFYKRWQRTKPRTRALICGGIKPWALAGESEARGKNRNEKKKGKLHPFRPLGATPAETHIQTLESTQVFELSISSARKGIAYRRAGFRVVRDTGKGKSQVALHPGQEADVPIASMALKTREFDRACTR